VRKWFKSALVLASTLWLLIVVCGAVSVFAFDQYERAWGSGASFQVYSWIATGAAAVALLCSGIGFSFGELNGVTPGPLMSALLAVVVVGASFGLLYLVPPSWDVGLGGFAVALALSTAGISYAACRIKRTPPNTSLERTRGR